MTVEESTRSGSPDAGARPGRAGGSHRAERRGPSPLLLLALVAAVVLVGGFFGVRALVGSDDEAPQAQQALQAPQASQPASADSASAPSEAADGGAELASDPSSVAAGTSLAANDRLILDAEERAELEEGRVDIRILALLALLSADYTIGIGDFAAPDGAEGDGLAHVVDIDAVDGARVAAPAGRELVATARDQLGVYKPREVSLVDGAIRIDFAPRDGDALPPVPIP